MKKTIKRVAAFLLASIMATSLLPTNVKAEENEKEKATEETVRLETGKTYSVPLIFWGYEGDNLKGISETSPRDLISDVAMVQVQDNGTYKVTLQADNAGKIDIFQVGKTDDGEHRMALGTHDLPDSYIHTPDSNRTEYPDTGAYPSKEAEEKLKAKNYISESVNDKYIQNVTKETGSVGVGYYTFEIDTLDEKVFIGAFRSFLNGNNYTSGVYRGNISFDTTRAEEVKAITAENYQSIGAEFARIYKHAQGTGWLYNHSLSTETSSMITGASATVNDGKVSATVTLGNSDEELSVRELTVIKDLGEYSPYPTADTLTWGEYKYAYPREYDEENNWYLSTYSENLLNKDGAFSLEFSDIREVVFGNKIELKIGNETYGATVRIHSKAKEEVVKTENGVTLTSDNYTIGDSCTFSVNKMAEDMEEGSDYLTALSALAQWAQAADAEIYDIKLTADGEEYEPAKNVELKFPIPVGWNEDEVDLYYMVDTGLITYAQKATELKGASVKVEDGYIKLNTSFTNQTYCVVRKNVKVDLSSLADGIYKVSATLWQQNNSTEISMANAAVNNDYAYLVVSDDGKTKKLYFELQGIQIATSFGYTSGIYVANNEADSSTAAAVLNDWEELEYYGYHTTENGSLDVDGYNVEYDLYYPKTVGLTLPESADRDDAVYLKFVVPIMDDLSNYEPGSGKGARIAKMELNGLESVMEYPTAKHDATVLQVAIDKAGKYEKSGYSDATWAVLDTAVKNAEDALKNEESLTDERVVELDKAVSDAIAGLKEPTALDQFNALKAEIESLDKTVYTAESWYNLESTLEQYKNVTESSAQTAYTYVKMVYDALIPVSSAVNLDEGVYEVQASYEDLMGNASNMSNNIESARLYADGDGKITVYLYTKEITSIMFQSGLSYAAASSEDTEDGGKIYSFTLPANVGTHRTLTMVGGSGGAAVLKLDLANVVKKDSDVQALKSAVDAAKKLTESDYTEETWKALQAMIESAEDVLAYQAAFPDEVQSAIDGIASATEGLVMTEEVAARKELEQLISDTRQNYLASNYEESSFAVLTEALEDGEKLLEDASASVDSIKTQITAINDAIKNLKRLDDAVNKDTLNSYIADAKTKTNEDNTYTEKSWAAFQAAIVSASKTAEDVNATQEEVEKQAELLNSAYQALVLTNRTSGLFEDYPQIYPGAYEVTIGLQNATSDEPSMGNASLNPKGVVRVAEDGTVTLEMNFQSMTFAGMEGYLYKLKKVDMDSVEYNQYNYPVKYEVSDATVLEEYTDVYDLFNDKSSEYYDANTNGEWYPKTLSIPINLNDNNFYVEVYVPVMESIGEGQGTKVARMVIDWANIKQISGVERDNSIIEALFAEVQNMEQADISNEVWNALTTAYESAYEVYSDMNATQAEIDLQAKALQAAMDAVETKTVDTEALSALLAEAENLLNKEDVVYTEVTREALEQAIADTKDMLSKEELTNAQIQAQTEKLQAAMDGLRIVDKSELSALLERAKGEYAKTDAYTDGSLAVLNAAITTAESVMNNAKATESDVNSAKVALNSALNALISKETVDKTELQEVIAEAESYLSKTDVYTESSLSSLKSAIEKAQDVYDNASASQDMVDKQVSNLQSAISELVELSNEDLDKDSLADGIYSIYGEMVKTDKSTESMSNNAINHTVKLTVKDGKYYITMNFNGLQYAGQYGYLKDLQYFLTGYTTNQYGVPQGDLADVTSDSYQTDSDGNRISDSFGTDYPDYVTFELIPEALEDGFVPLQVFVPIMESIADGTGTQAVYLKLDWSSLKLTEADDPDFEDDGNNDNNNDNNNNNNNGNGNGGSGLSGGSGLGNNTLGSTLGGSSLGGSSLGGSSLGGSSPGGSGLKSGSSLTGASSVKTDDTSSDISGWAAVLAIGCMALLVGVLEKRSQKKNKGM